MILSDSCQAVSSPYWDLNDLLNLNELFLYKIILFYIFVSELELGPVSGIVYFDSFGKYFKKVSLFYKERSSMESNQNHKELLKSFNIEPRTNFNKNLWKGFSDIFVADHSNSFLTWVLEQYIKWINSGYPVINYYANRFIKSGRIFKRLF